MGFSSVGLCWLKIGLCLCWFMLRLSCLNDFATESRVKLISYSDVRIAISNLEGCELLDGTGPPQ